MRGDVLRSKDFWAGVIYVSIAGAALWIGRDYRMGTAAKMGSGYFPMVLAGILLVIGLVSLLRSAIRPGPQVEPIALKPLMLIGAACIAFGVLLDRAGLVVALGVLCLIGASASRSFRVSGPALAGLAGFVGACAFVFVMGLGIPMPLFGR